MLRRLPGPSTFWRCPNCNSILQKTKAATSGLQSLGLQGASIVGSVSCGSCSRSHAASAVYGGQYDLPEVDLHCPHCSTHIRGPEIELLGQPCPACNRTLPTS